MRTWCDVSLDNLKHNIEQIKGKLSDNVKLCGIVKANAYGHGVEEIVLNLVQQGVDYLAVAFIDEAIEIRLCGFNQPLRINASHAASGGLICFICTFLVSREQLSFA